MRRRRQPDVGDSGGGDVVDLAHHHVVPPAALLPRLPVEALPQNSDQNSVQNIHDRGTYDLKIMLTVTDNRHDLT